MSKLVPFERLHDQLMKQMNELMQESWHDPFTGAWMLWGRQDSEGLVYQHGPQGLTKAWLPAIEVSETESKYQIKAELPGVDPDKLSVDVQRNRVIIEGHSEMNSESRDQQFHRSEFRYGRFYRQLPLPDYVDSASSQAEFRHGILAITFDKHQHTQRNPINIKVRS